jgi:hypothetical protein
MGQFGSRTCNNKNTRKHHINKPLGNARPHGFLLY